MVSLCGSRRSHKKIVSAPVTARKARGLGWKISYDVEKCNYWFGEDTYIGYSFKPVPVANILVNQSLKMMYQTTIFLYLQDETIVLSDSEEEDVIILEPEGAQKNR